MDRLAPFRPRVARLVAWGLLALVVVAVAALMVASFTTLEEYGWVDRVLTLLFAGAGGVIIHRQATVVAIPSEAGLRVRNLFVTTDIEWAQIVRVNFMRGHPWVTLDLSDGDTVAVMAIQSADGERGLAEARRLASLVAEREPPDA
ncbi:MAG: PH domain-containing protein [Actinomycetota bacterium]